MGFEKKFNQSAMFLDVSQRDYLPESDLDFEKITTSEQVDIWCDIASRSFGYDIYNPVIYKLIGKTGVELLLVSR